MEIKTKFSIGDRLFYIYKINKGKWIVSSYIFKVCRIIITDDGYYYLDFLNITVDSLEAEEQDLFVSKEEAQTECDKRNKGE